jgi:hypothetical protein
MDFPEMMILLTLMSVISRSMVVLPMSVAFLVRAGTIVLISGVTTRLVPAASGRGRLVLRPKFRSGLILRTTKI